MESKKSTNEIKKVIAKDMSNIHNYYLNVRKFINAQFGDTIDYLHDLVAEISQSAPGPSTTRMSEISEEKCIQRVETIPENDVTNINNTASDSTETCDKTENKHTTTGNVVETTINRPRREAALKTVTNIKKQQSMSDEKSIRGRTKRNKAKKSVLSGTTSRRIAGASKIHSQEHLSIREDTIQPEKVESLKSSTRTKGSNIKRTVSQSKKTKGKNSNIIDDTIIATTRDDIEKLSMSEDALEKFIPLMNSTLYLDTTYTVKTMNTPEVSETLSKLNETVVINKNLDSSTGKDNESKLTLRSPVTLQQLKETMANKEFDELIAEGELSSEVKESKADIEEREIEKRQKGQNRSMTSSEDTIPDSPTKPCSRENNTSTEFQKRRSTKSNVVLFDPYRQVSVKKRIEAFEQAHANYPKLTVNIDGSNRIINTNTPEENAKAAEKDIAYKLARKLVAKAKRISLAKQNKDADESRKQEGEQQRSHRPEEEEKTERTLTEPDICPEQKDEKEPN